MVSKIVIFWLCVCWAATEALALTSTSRNRRTTAGTTRPAQGTRARVSTVVARRTTIASSSSPPSVPTTALTRIRTTRTTTRATTTTLEPMTRQPGVVPPLTIAASSGAIRRMKNLIEAGADPNEVDWLGQTAMHLAAKFQQPRAAQLLLRRGANCCIPNPDFEETPLHLAAKTGSLTIIQLLIDGGANVNARISKHIYPGGTPLLYAALYDGKSHAAAKLLLEHGADATETNTAGDTALHMYADQLNLRAVAVLIGRFGTDPNIRNGGGCTTLTIMAAQDSSGNSNQLAIASYLLERGAYVDSRCASPKSRLRTPLHGAALRSNRQIVELLLDHGAMVNATDRDGYTPLYVAVVLADQLSLEIVDLLLRRGSDPRLSPIAYGSYEAEPCSSILAAFLRRNLPIDTTSSAVVKLLLSYGARRDGTCETDDWPLINKYLNRASSQAAFNEPVIYLEEGAPQPNIPSPAGAKKKRASPLIKAASFGDAETIEKLLNSANRGGSTVDDRDSYGKTALHWAVSSEYMTATRALLKAGADVNAEDNGGMAAIDYAASSGNVDLIKLLLLNGAIVRGSNALKHAVEESNSPEAVELLLDAGASLGTEEDGQSTLLHAATMKQNIRMMQLLIQHGADVNAKSRYENGMAPLSYLLDSDCCYPQIPVLSVLLDHGADVNTRDNAGRSPLNIAMAFRRRREVIKFLLDHGAYPNSVDNNLCNPPLFQLAKLASTESGRFYLHTIGAEDDDAEVAQIAKDLLRAGALPDRRDPCTRKTPLDIFKNKSLPLTTQVILDNVLYKK